jgi:hypothetical protein
MNGGVASVVQTAVDGGSELLIFVPRAAHRHDLSLSFVVRWTLSVQRRFRMEKSSTLSIGPQEVVACAAMSRASAAADGRKQVS